MSKIITRLLFTGVALLCTFISMAQPPTVVLLPANSTVAIGDTISIQVTANDFVDISGFSGTIDWDPALLDFVDVPVSSIALPGMTPPNCGGPVCSFNTNFVGIGEIPFTWFDLSGVEYSFDGDTLYTMRFEALANGIATVTINSDKTNFRITVPDGMGSIMDVEPEIESSIINIGGVMSNPCAGFPDLAVYAENDSASTGQQVCLDISACNFDDMVTMSYTLEFDPSLMSFDSVGFFNLPQSSAANFNTNLAANGLLTFSWFDSLGTGVNFPDAMPMYSACFTLTGPGGSIDTLIFSDSLTLIQASDTSFVDMAFDTQDGTAKILGSGSAAMSISVASETVMENDPVCLDVTVDNFTDMLSLDLTMDWDPAILQFDSITDPNGFFAPNITGSFDTSPALVNAGNLTMEWSSPTPVTQANNYVLFQVCYTAIGAAGTNSDVVINSDVVPIDATASDGMGGSIPVTVNPSLGNVNILGSGVFTFNTTDLDACPGDTVCVEFLASSWNQYAVLEFTLSWDQTLIQYHSAAQVGLPSGAAFPGGFNTTQTAMGNLGFSWADLSLSGVPLMDGDTILQFCFVMLAPDGTNVPFEFTNDVNSIGVGGINGPAMFQLDPGEINITDAACFTMTPLVVSSAITDIDCNGETTGAIDLTVSGGSPGYTYNWTGPNTFTSTDEDLTGLEGGTYDVTITDAMGVTFTDSYVVAEAPALVLSETSVNLDCNGETDGEIDLTVTGGTGAYTFLWDDAGNSTTEDLTGLAAATYKVIVTDANGCSDSLSIDITEPAVLAISSTEVDVSCNGEMDGEIDLTVTGGTGAYTFLWDDAGNSTTEDLTGLAVATYKVIVTDVNGCSDSLSIDITEPAALDLSATTVPASCNGGTDGEIDLTVTGGTGAYTFLWDDAGNSTTEDLTGLAAATYKVIVTDVNGCSDSLDVTVAENVAFSVSGIVTNVSCNGEADGSINLTVTGNSGAPTFMWDNGAGTNEDASGLAPNTYSVTVTDNGCSVIETFMITEPAVLTASTIVTDINCNGTTTGIIDLTITGGTTPYAYNWDNGIGNVEDPTNLAANNYCVTVTDANDCVVTTCVMVNEPLAISITGVVVGQSATGLNDGEIDITVVGGTTPYMNFSWVGPAPFTASTEDLTGLEPGSYTVTVTDNLGCTQVATFVVPTADAPTVTGSIITDALCAGEATGAVDIMVSGGVTPYTFIWDNAPPSTTEDLTNVLAGSYSVTITDAVSNTAVFGPFVVADATTITYSETHQDVSCNGVFDGEIHLTISGGAAPYSVAWNIAVLNGPDLIGLSPGVYTPVITDNNGCTLQGTAITIDQPTALDIAVNVATDVSCNGDSDGEINITPSGGTAPYTVLWSNNATTEDLTGIPAGSYTPVVTDANGCTATIAAITISEPTAVAGNAVLSPILCTDDTNGEIDLSPSGGTAPYTFLWDNGLGVVEDVTNLSPGSYSVTVTDADGCSVEEGPFTFTNPTPIAVSENIISPTAANNDGSIDLVVSGGSSPYNFNWTGPGGPYTGEPITGLGSGEYRVTVTDANGCVAFETYLLLGAFSTNGQVINASCNGGSDGSVELFVQGGIGPYSYEWSNNTTFTNLLNVPAGNYCVTVTDLPTMAVIVECFDVGEPTPIMVTATNVVDETGTGCNGSISMQILGGNAPYTYLWSNGATSKNITDVCKGDYTLAVTDANGCFIESDVITVLAAPLVCSNIDTEDTKCHDSEDGSATITFFGGCEPYTIQLSNNASQTSLDGEVTFMDLASGSYTGNIFDNQGQAKSFTFTIESPDTIKVTEDNIIPNTGGASCNGAVNISIEGGVPPYTTTWSNGASSEDLSNVCGSGSPYSVTVIDANGCVFTMGGFVVPDLPVININTNLELNETCFQSCDGQLSVSASGGAAPFSYLWSNGETTQAIANLCADSYTVTITDGNGTTQEATYLITGATAALTETGAVTDAQGNVNNGSILLTVVGGVPPYTYEWSNGASTNPVIGLGAGVYNVVITDANDCIINGSYIVGSNVLLVEALIDAPSCSGDADGCIEASPLTGQGPYTYLWSNGQTASKICGLAGGDYQVTITDAAGLIGTQEYTLTDPNPINLQLEELGAGAAEVIVNGGTAPFTYAWNDANGSTTQLIEEVRPGEYGVLVTDANGCSAQGSIEIRPQGDCEDVRRVISPNSDGKNDEFVVVCVYDYPQNSLEVYNRYGQQVYQADNYDNTWQGTDRSGAPLPESGYFWVFKYRDADGIEQTVKGDLTILVN